MAFPSAIFFDFDGVIVNSEPLHFLGFQIVLKDAGIELSEEEYYRELIGFDDRGAFKHLFAKKNISIDSQQLLHLMKRKSHAVEEMIEHRRYHALPGVDEFVRGLAKHYPLAICSGALREEIESMLDGVKLREYFPIIVAAQDVPVGKPDPRGYLLTMKLISQRINKPLKPADCLVIEDAPAVISSVNAEGFKTLAVATSYPLEKLAHATWAVKTLRPEEVAQKIPQLKIGAIQR